MYNDRDRMEQERGPVKATFRAEQQQWERQPDCLLVCP